MDNKKVKVDNSTDKLADDKINRDSPKQRRLFEKMGMRIEVTKPKTDTDDKK